MKFSGHETFHVREGWLHKGLTLVGEQPEAFSAHEYVHDELGVGSNMAKSIRHWLLVTGLIELGEGRGTLVPTELGKIILKHDPYFVDPVTWWVLHINLVANESSATTWHWFFNYFYQLRFEKRFCVDTIKRHLLSKQSKIPSRKTLERDVECLLACYSNIFPEDPTADPEDSYDCPFQDLGLLTYFRETNTYQFTNGNRTVPHAAILYCLSRNGEGTADGKSTTILMSDASKEKNGPGKCFALTASEIYELVENASRAVGEDLLSITGMAADRAIRYCRRPPLDWVTWHFTKRKGR
jgi:hypothetical protein